MRALVILAVGSCTVLLLALAGVWRILRRERPEPQLPRRKPMMRERRVHPRLDLAVGLVPASQSVRSRHRGVTRQPVAVAAAAGKRPDWAYFHENLGDLRDPDTGLAPLTALRPTGTLGRPDRR